MFFSLFQCFRCVQWLNSFFTLVQLEITTIQNLLTKHPSKPYNPDIANAFFRSGYIESWGRGTLKIMKECKDAGIPEPLYDYDMSGFFVEFRKNIFNESYLKSQGLNERQIKTVILLKEKGRITNKEYQELFSISRETASRDLAELTEKGMFENLGGKGAGSYFKLK